MSTIALLLSAGIDGPALASAPAGEQSKVEFNRDIRPLLSEYCYQCHGPDSGRRKANLRLDQKEGALADLGDHRAIVPGDPDASEMYRRIVEDDPGERMPPPASGKVLSPVQIERIGHWIKQGAAWQDHWSFVTPERPAISRTCRPDWSHNPIDNFVLERIERENLVPSPEADRASLIRRVTLDLIGLPPTPSEVDAFQADPSPSSYERVVDRLLASPRFGERMAVRWLNAARYADTSGYQTDGERFMWRWRDWVIDAYNRNMPFDRFTIEQLAGDLLPGATLDQKIATGFNRNHRGNGEGGIIPEEFAVEYVVDRVETTSTVWLGLTIGCTRCHNHKYDPISNEEFYRLYAFFNKVPESGRAVKYGNSPPSIKAPTRTDREALARLEARLSDESKKFDGLLSLRQQGQSSWERELRATSPEVRDRGWTISNGLLALYSFDGKCASRPATDREKDRDGSRSHRFVPGKIGLAVELDGRRFVEAGDVAPFGFYDKFTIATWIRPKGQRGGTILSRMTDEFQADGYSIVLKEGRLQVNLVKRWLDDALRVETQAKVPSDRWTHVAVSYDGSREARGVRVYIDGRQVATRVLIDELNQTFQSKEPLRIGGGNGPEGRFTGAIDEVHLHSSVLDDDEIAIIAEPESIATIASLSPASRSRSQSLKLNACFLETSAPAEVRRAYQNIREIREQIRTLIDSFPSTMIMADRPGLRETFVLQRGQYDRPGKKVEAGTPSCLLPMSIASRGQPNRLDLARWLVNPAHPLTSRVAINRLWQMLYGTGLVKTVDDFGAQGEWPSHPELLDWLSSEFIAQGWDVKAMLRLMVTSATYRQASRSTPPAYLRDPENRLLARGPRHRLAAEAIRDQALAVSGLLAERIGGPSVKPYQPDGLWSDLSDSRYVQEHGDSLYRRGIYTYWKRTIPPPTMINFDAPGRETCFVRESRTNTPLQALNLLNDITAVEAARALAERAIHEGGENPRDRLAWAFKCATARPPLAQELSVLVDNLYFHRRRFTRNRAAALALIRVGESAPRGSVSAEELASYTATAQVILNLDEVITKE